MQEYELKYGCNPNQKPARIYMADGKDLPIKVLCGRAGYINFLDAFNGWQLVKELKKATGLPAATSFKHVSPAGAAVGLPLSDVEKKIYWVDDMDIEFTPLANAYIRARGADRMSSFGDFISLSDICDAATAKVIKREVSDGVIAPGYTEEALEILKQKKKGNYCVIEIDPAYEPAPIEHKDVFGITFEQGRNELHIGDDFFDNIVTENKELLLVRQFRYPYKEILLEIPAGKLEKGEDPFEAGKREFKEECGATADSYFSLGEVYPSPGYCGEIIHLYGAAGLHFGQQHLDEGEYLDVVRMPLDEAVRRVMTGEIKDAKTAIAILKLKERINP